MSTSPPITKYQQIKALIWLYFWLLIFEGALRKWILPGLSTPLLLVREPVVLAIYLLALGQGVFPKGRFVNAIFGLSIVNLCCSSIINSGHPAVTFYGLRADFFHLPLALLLPAVFTQRDVCRIGSAIMLLSAPMALLVYLQFTHSPESRINAGAGVDSMQIEAAAGRIRPAGTFSYSTGLISYVTLLAAFLFHSCFQSKAYPKWLLLPAVPSLFLMIALSGSRSTLSAVSILVIMAAAISIYKPRLFAGSLKAISAVCCVYFVVGSWAVFRQGVDVLNERIQGNGGVKSGLVDRYIDSMLPLYSIQNAPLLGYGIGMGTNAASGMLTGTRSFMFAENEWDRVILESGALLGLGYIVLRVCLVFKMGRESLTQLNRGDSLASLLFAAGFLQVLNGQFAQPTALGFGVLGAGLCLAATNRSEQPNSEFPPSPAAPQLPRAVPGRSAYAEKLHGK